MKTRLLNEIIYRSFYLAIAIVAFLSSLCFWNVGEGSFGEVGFNIYIINDFFVWALIMSIVCTSAALKEDMKIFKSGNHLTYTKKFPFLKFCTFSSMIFCFIMGAFFVNRISENRLTDTGLFYDIYPGILTSGYWLDLSVFLTRFVCPLMFIAMYMLFEEKGKTRDIYGRLGIMPPTWFYLFNKIFGVIMAKTHGGPEGLLEEGLYAIAYPFFFYDPKAYHQWYWIILWPSIFGLGLLLINRVSLILSRVVTDDKGKRTVIKKPEIIEDEMCDIFHKFKKKKKK